MLETRPSKTVYVRFFASARAAAGTESTELQLASDASVEDAVHTLREQQPSALAKILAAASYLVDGVAVRDRSKPLPAGSQLDVLPPFAGG